MNVQLLPLRVRFIVTVVAKLPPTVANVTRGNHMEKQKSIKVEKAAMSLAGREFYGVSVLQYRDGIGDAFEVFHREHS